MLINNLVANVFLNAVISLLVGVMIKGVLLFCGVDLDWMPCVGIGFLVALFA